MIISFHANCVAVEDMDEDEYWLVGFADEQFDTRKYLMLQRGYEDDEQEVRLGQNTYYVERDGQQWSMYGGIDRIKLFRDSVMVRFTPEGAQRLETDGMNITFKADSLDFEKLKERMERVFAKTDCLVLQV